MPRGEKVPQTALRTDAADIAPDAAPLRLTAARRRETDALRSLSWRLVYREPDRLGVDVLLVAKPGTSQLIRNAIRTRRTYRRYDRARQSSSHD